MRQRLHGRQSLRFGRVVEHQQHDDDSDGACNRRPEESGLPAGYRNDAAHEDEGEELAEVVACREKTVIGSPLLERIPAREGDDCGRRTHGLRPPVQTPHHGE